ncbi:hypothetical protein B0H66DRAFT_628516 [Apodospora peruviana]|uniref:Endothelin-converting enzyme 1 n=1 Tax=Apodospora peruviana TaxID=516989 RepID=A0AAE0HYX4_9PEZI|nr:hypothetical protein B0H66DRAFT_628516 [Apodospora peruviana]
MHLCAASSVFTGMARNWQKLDPCAQFDKMVCGSVPEKWAQDTQFLEEMEARNNRMLRNILESPYQQVSEYHSILARNNIDEDNFNMLQRDYHSCMNTTNIDAAGAKPLTDLLVAFDQLWPITTDDTHTKLGESESENLSKAIIYLDDLGVSTFRALYSSDGNLQVVTPDYSGDPKVVVPTIEPLAAAHSNTTAYDDDEAMQAYADSLAKLFSGEFYFSNISESSAAIIAKGVVEFERKILATKNSAVVEYTALAQPEDPQELIGMVKLPITELTTLAPAFSFDKTLTPFLPANYKLNDVIVHYSSFWNSVSKIITDEPKTIVQSWMEAVNTAIQRTQPTTPRWEQCLTHTTKSLGWVLARLFVSATYSDAARDYTDKMTTSIKSAFSKRLTELNWMTDAVKNRAVSKSVAQYYSNLTIAENNYFANVLSQRSNTIRTGYAKLASPSSRSDVGGPDSVTVVNAYYSSQINAIFIQAGISQLPFFHPDLPAYANYGGLGAVIGHEITHGFDNEGHKWDEDGAALVPVSTSGETRTVNGELTLGENLSDAGGLRAAFDAWKAFDGKDADLPGFEKLGMTHEQLFFVFYAQAWCNSNTPEHNAEGLDAVEKGSDNHSPGTVRIKGATDNSRGF